MKSRLERNPAPRWLGFGAAIVASVVVPCASTLTTACSNCNQNGHEPILYTAGRTRGDVYETGAPTDEMLHFPSGRVYDLKHDLGSVPAVVIPYISFVPRPIAGDAPSRVDNVALAAGNEVVIEYWDDLIRVRNDTCAEFFLRVVALGVNEGAGGAP